MKVAIIIIIVAVIGILIWKKKDNAERKKAADKAQFERIRRERAEEKWQEEQRAQKQAVERASVQPTNSGLKTEVFTAVGAQYYTENIDSLKSPREEWNMTVAQVRAAGKEYQKLYRYNYLNKPLQLIPEPNNPHDKNAISVQVAGKVVGYIKREDNTQVADLLKQKDIAYISGFIGGGPYKSLTGDTFQNGTDQFSVKIKIAYK